MLVLSRRPHEALRIGAEIRIEVISIEDDQVTFEVVVLEDIKIAENKLLKDGRKFDEEEVPNSTIGSWLTHLKKYF